jgi:hypothetical protein
MTNQLVSELTMAAAATMDVGKGAQKIVPSVSSSSPSEGISESVRAKANADLCAMYGMMLETLRVMPSLNNIPKSHRDLVNLFNKATMTLDYCTKTLRSHILSTVDAKIERKQLEQIWDEEANGILPSDIISMNNFFGEEVLPTTAPPQTSTTTTTATTTTKSR